MPRKTQQLSIAESGRLRQMNSLPLPQPLLRLASLSGGSDGSSILPVGGASGHDLSPCSPLGKNEDLGFKAVLQFTQHYWQRGRWLFLKEKATLQ